MPNAHNGVMLHTAQSIKDLLLSKHKQRRLIPNTPNSPSDNGNENEKYEMANESKQTISVLQWNIWAIGPLLEEISSFDSTQNVTALVQSETNNNDGSMKAIALFDCLSTSMFSANI